MKAKIRTRNEGNHVNLGDVLPISTPYVLIIEPASICNQRCLFCPTGNSKDLKVLKNNKGILDFDLFKKIIDDTKNFDSFIKVVRLYKMGEPLLNPFFSKMVKYAKKSVNIKKIDTTTNGLLLNSKLNTEIIKAGIDQINISVNGVSADQIFKFTRTKINFDRYVGNIKDLYEKKENCTIYIRAFKQNLSVDDQKRFFEMFGNFADRIFLENLIPNWPEFQINEKNINFKEGIYGQEVLEKKVCPYIFYTMVINSDGSISACLQDWKRKLIAGNSNNESLRDIWLGNILDAYRLEHLKGNRNHNPICANCGVISYGFMDNIDNSSTKILYRLKNKTFN